MTRGTLRLRRGRTRTDECGFTLMELLVAMSVVSLLSVTILFGWRVAAGAWGRANELVEKQRRIAAVHQVLQQQMTAMTPWMPWLRQGNAEVFFQGEPRTARFLSRYSLVHRSRSGLYRIEYQIGDAGEGTRQLLVNELPLMNFDDSGLLLVGAESSPGGTMLRFAPFEQTPQTRVLLAGLADARFEYYRPGDASGPGGWATEWHSRGNELPRAMAIRATTRSGESAVEPLSIVAEIENYSLARR